MYATTLSHTKTIFSAGILLLSCHSPTCSLLQKLCAHTHTHTQYTHNLGPLETDISSFTFETERRVLKYIAVKLYCIQPAGNICSLNSGLLFSIHIQFSKFSFCSTFCTVQSWRVLPVTDRSCSHVNKSVSVLQNSADPRSDPVRACAIICSFVT